jgi:FAD synthase
VAHGFGRGARQLGFPTANLDTTSPGVESALQLLEPGVYAGYAAVIPPALQPNDGALLTWYSAAVNIGKVPTFANPQLSIEAHLLHQFTMDFYNHLMQLILLAYLRPERKFDSLEMLKQQIHSDIEQTRETLGRLDFQPGDYWSRHGPV